MTHRPRSDLLPILLLLCLAAPLLAKQAASFTELSPPGIGLRLKQQQDFGRFGLVGRQLGLPFHLRRIAIEKGKLICNQILIDLLHASALHSAQNRSGLLTPVKVGEDPLQYMPPP